MPAASPALRALEVDEILDGSFALYRRRFLGCFTAMALVQVPTAIGFTLLWHSAFQRIQLAGHDAGLLAQASAFALLTFLPAAFLYFTATQIGTGAVTYLVGRHYAGRSVGVIESYRWALRRSPQLLAIALLLAVATFGGLFLFVVPGVIAYLVSFAAVPVVMLEGKGVMASLRRSYELATGSLGRVAAVRLVIALFLAVCVVIGYALFRGATEREEVRLLLLQIPTLLAGPLEAISTVVLYYDLRVRREGMDLERMAAEMGEA